ncbi:hypothetical protein [Pseudomonas cremoricolorata]|uniref:hypothetical protein n=1 Tax=Pseudomonas cremoricolorata TaxID=157783 RepID=UPI0004058D7D|nr:hypothetical protein [Pseudomonas cremoricolorata]
MWVDKVQVGIDLATSVTILIAAGTFWANARKERKIGVADSARSTIIDNINASITDMAQSFNAFVRLSTSIEDTINTPLRLGETYLAARLKSGQLSAAEIIAQFSNSVTAMGEFYEKGEMLKYTIFPSLYSIGDEHEAVEIIKKEITDVMNSHNQCNSTHLSYLRSILALDSKIKALQAEGIELSGSNIMSELCRVVDDSDHFPFLESFLKTEHEQLFQQSIAKSITDMTDEEKNIRNTLLNTLLGMMISESETVIAYAFKRLSYKVQENRIQCKEFLVTLSAVSSKMQQRSSDFSIKQAYVDLSSERYFDTKGTIR